MQLSDYDWLKPNVRLLEESFTAATKFGVRIDLGHPHRLWEYAMAMTAFYSWMDLIKPIDRPFIVDVGSGCGLLAPTFSYKCKIGMEEVEPDFVNFERRVVCNGFLRSEKKPEIKWHHSHLQSMSNVMRWDVVFCISVVEHVKQAAEEGFWKELAKRVRPGGLLFMTTDIVANSHDNYVFDNLRETNYTDQMLATRVKLLESCGMRLFGKEDLDYHETNVHDYDFASICMTKS